MKKSEQALVPKLRFPEFKEGEGWHTVTLQSTAAVNAGQSPRGEYYNETGDGTPFYQGKTDFGDVFINNPTKWTTQVTTLALANDILISVRAPVGALNISTQEICIGRGLAGLRAKDNYLFLYYLLLRVNQLFVGNGGSVFDSITKSQIENTKIPYTLITTEQNKIADCLSSLDDLITAESSKMETLKIYRNGLLQKFFPQPGQTRPQLRFREFKNEPGWDETTIGDLGTFYYGKSAPKWSLDENAPTPCVRYGELYTKFGATITEIYSRTNIDPRNLRFSKGGEILVPRVGEKPEDFGKCCSYLTLKNIAIGEMISVFETKQNPLFYTYYFRNMYKQFAVVVEGQNVKNLYYNKLQPLTIHRPSLPEQQKIAECLSAIDERIDAQAIKIETLKQHKRGLMQQLFPIAEGV